MQQRPTLELIDDPPAGWRPDPEGLAALRARCAAGVAALACRPLPALERFTAAARAHVLTRPGQEGREA